MKQILSPVKIFGGKKYLVKDLLNIIKPDKIYVEPFLGGGNLLLNMPTNIKRYGFDKDELLINTWKTIQSDSNKLISILKTIDYNEDNFNYAVEYIGVWNNDCDPLETAAMYLVRNRFSRAGLNKDYGWSDRLRRGMPEYISAWKSMLDNLPKVSNIIQGVVFDCGCCRELMQKYDLLNNSECTTYFDPPYVFPARSSKNVYKHEMLLYNKDTDNPQKVLTHEGIWDMIRCSKCKFFVSGYYSEAYEDFGAKPIFTKDMPNHSGQGKYKQRRKEIIWSLV